MNTFTIDANSNIRALASLDDARTDADAFLEYHMAARRLGLDRRTGKKKVGPYPALA